MYKAYQADKNIETVNKSGEIRYRTDFIADSAQDMESIKKECSDYPAGSTAYVAASGAIYILNCQQEWKGM